ncbi:glycosyltransferase family 39 protein [candidate division KSB1 bacterium]|nr:glycosyltransferase family 39 protein [candidate division KSB1 bacterium]
MKKHIMPIVTIALIFLLRILVLMRLDIFPDEAYYWDWSRFLSFGYYDHPPMVAWLVHLTTALFGDTYWGIKAAPLLTGLGVSIVMFLLATRYLKSVSLVLLVIILNATLLYAVGGLLLTPDIPFLFFWSLGLFVGYEAVFKNCTPAWLTLGMVAGLGLLSKYLFLLFIGSFGLYLLIDKSYRPLLLTWKPWLALLLAALFFSPNLLWNARHAWASYAFQFGHGFNSAGAWPKFNLLLEYLGGQVGLFSPFLFVVLVLAVIFYFRHGRESSLLYLLTFLAVPLLFFTWSSLGARVEANWPAPAFLSGLIILLWYYERLGPAGRLRKFVRFSMLFSIMTTVLVVLHAVLPFLPIPPKQDRTLDSRGWDALAQQIDAIRGRIDPVNEMPLCANTYQLGSLLAFHCQDQPRTWALNLSSRTNHYAYLEGRASIIEDSLLFVTPVERGALPRHLEKYFLSANRLALLERPMTASYADSFAIYAVRLSQEAKEEILHEALPDADGSD